MDLVNAINEEFALMEDEKWYSLMDFATSISVHPDDVYNALNADDRFDVHQDLTGFSYAKKGSRLYLDDGEEKVDTVQDSGTGSLDGDDDEGDTASNDDSHEKPDDELYRAMRAKHLDMERLGLRYLEIKRQEALLQSELTVLRADAKEVAAKMATLATESVGVTEGDNKGQQLEPEPEQQPEPEDTAGEGATGGGGATVETEPEPEPEQQPGTFGTLGSVEEPLKWDNEHPCDSYDLEPSGSRRDGKPIRARAASMLDGLYIFGGHSGQDDVSIMLPLIKLPEYRAAHGQQKRWLSTYAEGEEMDLTGFEVSVGRNRYAIGPRSMGVYVR